MHVNFRIKTKMHTNVRKWYNQAVLIPYVTQQSNGLQSRDQQADDFVRYLCSASCKKTPSRCRSIHKYLAEKIFFKHQKWRNRLN